MEKTVSVIGFRACRYAEALIAGADRTIISSSPTPLSLSRRVPWFSYRDSDRQIPVSKPDLGAAAGFVAPVCFRQFRFFSLSLSPLPSFLPFFPFRNSATPQLPLPPCPCDYTRIMRIYISIRMKNIKSSSDIFEDPSHVFREINKMNRTSF